MNRRTEMNFDREPDTAVAGVVMMDRSARFLLQRRDDNPAISSPGMISVFGGHKENGESDLDCAIREVKEETGLPLEPAQLRLIAKTHVEYGDGTIREGAFYFADKIDPGSFRVTEGTLILIPYRQLGSFLCEMVPMSAYVMALIDEHIRYGRLRFEARDQDD